MNCLNLKTLFWDRAVAFHRWFTRSLHPNLKRTKKKSTSQSPNLRRTPWIMRKVKVKWTLLEIWTRALWTPTLEWRTRKPWTGVLWINQIFYFRKHLLHRIFSLVARLKSFSTPKRKKEKKKTPQKNNLPWKKDPNSKKHCWVKKRKLNRLTRTSPLPTCICSKTRPPIDPLQEFKRGTSLIQRPQGLQIWESCAICYLFLSPVKK